MKRRYFQRGKAASASVIAEAAKQATSGAKPLPMTGYKLDLLQGVVQDLLNLFPASGHTTIVGLRESSRNSHALAVTQSRFTVAGETPTIVAVSSIERPAKKRSSTM